MRSSPPNTLAPSSSAKPGPRAVTLGEVRSHREAIVRLAESFGIRNVRIFGSVARGEATDDSDLDLLVDVDRGHGYLDMAGFALGVEDELGVFRSRPRNLTPATHHLEPETVVKRPAWPGQSAAQEQQLTVTPPVGTGARRGLVLGGSRWPIRGSLSRAN
jgi:uncharacterized protein